MSSTGAVARRCARVSVACAIASALIAGGAPIAGADPAPPVIPSAAQVAAAASAATDAASAAAAIDAQLADARASLSDVQDRAELAAQAYNQGQELLDQRQAESASAAQAAADAQAQADVAQLALSRYAAEIFQGGGGLGQLDVFFGGSPGEVLDRAAGLEAVGDERARIMREADAAQALAQTARTAAAEAADRQAQAAADLQARLSQAQADQAAAADAAVALQTQQDQALVTLAALRKTSVQLEKDRQAGLAAQEQARIEAENRRKAAEAAAKAAAEAAAKAAAEAAAKAAAEAAARAAAQAAAKAAADAAAKAAADAAAKAVVTKPKATATPTPSPTTGNPSPTTTPSDPATVNPPPAPSAGVAAVIAFARAQLGEPYVWAAAGPNTWDCSGLTMMAWRQAGVSLGHYTGTQYDQTARVAIADLRPGDLVFFGYSVAGIHHVGLYIGNGQMIHAPQTGDVVKISSIYASRDLWPWGGRPS